MVNVKFIIDAHIRYEYLDNKINLEKFFLQHKKIKRNVLYKMSVYIKKRNKYFLSDINNLYVYINKQVLIIDNNSWVNVKIKENWKCKIVLNRVPMFLYHIYVTDQLKTIEYFYIQDKINIKSLLAKKLKKHHIEYIQCKYDKKQLFSITVLVTYIKKPCFYRFLKYNIFKSKN